MKDLAPREVTVLLRAWSHGDREALDRLLPIVYGELRRIAGRAMHWEGASRTLRPTEMVSEAYLRLAAGATPEWNDRVHFFAVAAQTMRHILVDDARARRAEKRGGGTRTVTLDEALFAGERPDELVAVDEALVALAFFDGRAARALELSYFAGMSHDEIAGVLGVAVRTVARDLRAAEAWIRVHLQDAPP